MKSQTAVGPEAITELKNELALLRREIESTRAARLRLRSRLRWGGIAVLAVGLTYVGGAIAQTSSCDSEGDLPEPLYTFCSGAAASAFEVNWNFRELAQQIFQLDDEKLDKVSSERLFIDVGEDAELNRSGSIVIGQESGPNLTMDSNEILSRDNGAGSTMYLNASNSGAMTVVGSGGDETRLTVKGNLKVEGSVNQECPSDTVQLGDSCMEKLARPVVNFWSAATTCDEVGRRICPAEMYALCDHRNPPGSDCTTRLEDSNRSFWTSTMTNDATWQPTAWYAGGTNSDRLVPRSTNYTHEYYCCESL